MIGPPTKVQNGRSHGRGGGPMAGATRVDSKAFRRRVGRLEVLETRSWLTERDRAICSDIYEHKVLTAAQIQQLHFTHPRIASRRLLKLFDHQVLDRFRPRENTGSAPNHYILGDVGLHVIAGERGLDLRKLRDRQLCDLKLAYSPRLRHLVAVNDFFTRLIVACRADAHHRVERWWSERRCAAECRNVVRPDGFGGVVAHEATCSFFFELDRGTERGNRLTNKLTAYEWFTRINPGTADALLFLFPSPEREFHARAKLAPIGGLEIATSHQDLFYRAPIGRIWLPVDAERRESLLEVPRGRARSD